MTISLNDNEAERKVAVTRHGLRINGVEIPAISGEFHYWRDLGLDGGEGVFQDFLKNKYGRISALNKAWNRQFADWPAVKAECVDDGRSRESFIAYKDVREFLHKESTRIGELYCDIYRNLGVEVPMFHNLLGYFKFHDWLELKRQVAFAGVDIYPAANFEAGGGSQEDVFAAGVGTHQKFVDTCKAAADLGGLGYIAEFQSGYISTGSRTLNQQHYRMTCVSALGAGISGWNWYMLVDRENWAESCITNMGNKNPDCFPEFQRIIELIGEQDLHKAHRKCGLGVIYDPLQEACGTSGREPEIRQLLYRGGIDYRRVDLRCREMLPEFHTLIYAGADYLSEESQETLKEWVSNGGTLIVFGSGVFMNERLEDCNVLEFIRPERTLDLFQYPDVLKVAGLADEEVSLDLPCSLFSEDSGVDELLEGVLWGSEVKFPMRPITSKNEERWSYGCGYKRTIGEGRLLVLGGNPASPASMRALLRSQDIEMLLRCEPEGVFASLLHAEDSDDLFVCLVNPGRADKVVRLFSAKRLALTSASL